MVRKIVKLVVIGVLATAAMPSGTAHAAVTTPPAHAQTYTHAGIYKVTDAQGQPGTLTITTGVAPAAPAGGIASAATSQCNYFSGTMNSINHIDWLHTNFCWNGSTAVGYSTGGSCTPQGLGASCQGQNYGDQCSYCSTAAAFGTYYQTCLWVDPCSQTLMFHMRANGSWWFDHWPV